MKVCLPYKMPELPRRRLQRDCAQVAALVLHTNNGSFRTYTSLFNEEYNESIGTTIKGFCSLISPIFQTVQYIDGEFEHLITELANRNPVVLIVQQSEYHAVVLVGADTELGRWTVMDESGTTTLTTQELERMWTRAWIQLRKKDGVVESCKSSVWSDIFTTRCHLVSDSDEGDSGEYPWP